MMRIAPVVFLTNILASASLALLATKLAHAVALVPHILASASMAVSWLV
jgi:hypothetical protein